MYLAILLTYLNVKNVTDKALSEEVMKLKDLFQEKHLCGRSQDSETPGSTLITTTRSKKRSRQSKDTVEMDMISPQVSHHNKCIFQAFGQRLLGMKLATSKQDEQVCIIAVIYQADTDVYDLLTMTGLSFSLTFVKKLVVEEESELLYKVVTLVIVESGTSMDERSCDVFFERVSRVIKLHCC
ncbi:hypothetical protein ARALYDRAFT_891982 [Arabidopsis lyrata subsp. lyrata]|uniref:DUF7806 domain-containing protein n=1 Tax=Arabidopsis lyrata subsp. lyrata TaxID=81972 RepID=D7KGP4_ARALL|nr:hypothetical protein ARALYDRAFT_891982 [Arabidopsis lyrata subsp. lyrata]